MGGGAAAAAAARPQSIQKYGKRDTIAVGAVGGGAPRGARRGRPPAAAPRWRRGGGGRCPRYSPHPPPPARQEAYSFTTPQWRAAWLADSHVTTSRCAAASEPLRARSNKQEQSHRDDAPVVQRWLSSRGACQWPVVPQFDRTSPASCASDKRNRYRVESTTQTPKSIRIFECNCKNRTEQAALSLRGSHIDSRKSTQTHIW